MVHWSISYPLQFYHIPSLFYLSLYLSVFGSILSVCLSVCLSLSACLTLFSLFCRSHSLLSVSLSSVCLTLFCLSQSLLSVSPMIPSLPVCVSLHPLSLSLSLSLSFFILVYFCNFSILCFLFCTFILKRALFCSTERGTFRGSSVHGPAAGHHHQRPLHALHPTTSRLPGRRHPQVARLDATLFYDPFRLPKHANCRVLHRPLVQVLTDPRYSHRLCKTECVSKEPFQIFFFNLRNF